MSKKYPVKIPFYSIKKMHFEYIRKKTRDSRIIELLFEMSVYRIFDIEYELYSYTWKKSEDLSIRPGLKWITECVCIINTHIRVLYAYPIWERRAW